MNTGKNISIAFLCVSSGTFNQILACEKGMKEEKERVAYLEHAWERNKEREREREREMLKEIHG